MTIKPINQKNAGDEKQDQQQKSNIQRDRDKTIRINVGAHSFENRRSPNKNCGRSKRDLKREKNPVATKYPQLVPTPSSVGASTSQAKKQLQLPCTASVSAKSQQSSAQQQQQQQNQIIINPISNSPIISSNVGSSESNLLADNDTNKISSVTNSSNIPIISSSVVGNNGGSSKEPVELLEILEEQVSGYNSGDEHLGQKDTLISNEEWKRRDENFTKEMSKRGLIIKDMEEDGACLFRAISFQMYGDQDMHEAIRQQTMDYIYQNREYFAQFITEDITKYVSRKRQNHLHGNHIEIQAMSEMYNRPVELYCYDMTPINIYNSEQMNNGYEPLRLSYHRYSHYNAILDPYKSSVGVGLGLAGYRPEEFDPTKQFNDAVQMSEQLEIEKMMVEDKLKTTDWEATSDVVVEQIARQSYLQYCKDNMSRHSKKTTSTSTITSTEAGGSSSTASSAESNSVPGAQMSSLPASSSSNNRDNETESTNSCSIEYYMQHQQIGRRKKRHQGIEKRKLEECSKQNDPQLSANSAPKRTKRSSPSPECPNTKQQNSPSTSSTPSSSTCESPNSEPLSAFYRSLLESSYKDDGDKQLSEQEMLQKALEMSAMDYIKRSDRNIATGSSSKCNNTDDEYDSP